MLPTEFWDRKKIESEFIAGILIINLLVKGKWEKGRRHTLNSN